jgi:hypothetical protein
VPEQWWDLVHGFETVNGLEDFKETRPKTVEALRAAMPGAMELEDSDAHSPRELSQACNETSKQITDEGRLISWLRSGRKHWREGVTMFLDGGSKEDFRKTMHDNARIWDAHIAKLSEELWGQPAKDMEDVPEKFNEVFMKNQEDILA